MEFGETFWKMKLRRPFPNLNYPWKRAGPLIAGGLKVPLRALVMQVEVTPV